MQRSCFFQFVMYIYFCCIAFGERQCRHRNLSVYGNSSFRFTCKIYNGISYIQIVTDSTGWSVIDNRFGKSCFFIAVLLSVSIFSGITEFPFLLPMAFRISDSCRVYQHVFLGAWGRYKLPVAVHQALSFSLYLLLQ